MARTFFVCWLLCVIYLHGSYGRGLGAIWTSGRNKRSAQNLVREDDFKELLGLKKGEVTNDAKNIDVPRYMEGLFNEIEHETGQDIGSETIKGIFQLRDHTAPKGGKFLHFDVSESATDADRAALVLRVKDKADIFSSRGVTCEVGVLEVLDKSGHVPLSLLDVKTVKTDNVTSESDQYHVFNVTRAVNKWLTDSASNNGFAIKVTAIEGEVLGQQRPHLIYHLHERSSLQPLLVLYSSKKHRDLPKPRFSVSRKVRSLPKSNPEKTHSKQPCQLFPWRLDFHSLQWTWIIQPRFIQINYCDGTCSGPDHVAPENNHAFLRAMFQQQLPTLPSPPCAPSELRPISILYVASDNTIIYRRMEKVLATSCSCS